MDAGHHAGRGGVGEYLPPLSPDGFGLKIVRLLYKDKNGGRNENFWNEAQSIHRFCASVRFLPGTMKIPMAAHYYLHKDDPLRKDMMYFRRDDENVMPIEHLFRDSFVEKTGWEQYLEYVPVSEKLLRRIYEEKLDADLLMIYPMAYGGEKNLASFYHKPFSADDARSLICQISAAILDLYRCGTAHGDIKPENIMVSEIGGRKIFRLTDFGSAHFNDAPSNTGTKAFFDRDLYEEIYRKTKTEKGLTARVYTDFYALHHTLMSLVLGYHPGPGCCNEDCVTDQWPAIREEWEMLQELDQRTMDDFRKLAAEEPVAVKPDWEPFYSPHIEFDSMIRVSDMMEYGWLHEQISFSNRFDPLMRVCGIETDRAVSKLFPEFCHVPLAKSPYEKIFHAPDDERTGLPPLNFRDYKPATLGHIQLTDEEMERLAGYGKKLNEYFHKHPHARACLPMKEDIFRCGGRLKMLWGKPPLLDRPIDYEAYFRFLAADRADFSIDDWLTLLPRLPELQYKLDRETCLKLLDLYSRDSRCVWFFGLETFLKHISGEKFDFSPRQWLQICSCTSRFDYRIDAETAWKMFKETGGTASKKQLKNHPRIAELLHSAPSPETDNELRVKAFLNLCKWDRETFLMYFPDGRRADLTDKQWDKCLQVNPGLIEFVPEEILPRLRRKTWVRLLGAEPGLIGRCPCAGRFSADEWGNILLQQPQLKKYCPAGIVLPDRMKKRLTKS